MARRQQLRESVPAHQPLAAAYTVPWPDRVAVWRSPGEDGFELATTFGRPARIGTLVADLYPGPMSRFDLGNVAIVDLAFGTLASVRGFTNFDNSVGLDAWTRIAIGATNNRFVGPVAGTYLFSGSLLFKLNSSTWARMTGAERLHRDQGLARRGLGGPCFRGYGAGSRPCRRSPKAKLSACKADRIAAPGLSLHDESPGRQGGYQLLRRAAFQPLAQRRDRAVRSPI